MIDKKSYQEKLSRERLWWEPPSDRGSFINRFVHRWLLTSQEQSSFAYLVSKERMAKIVALHQKSKCDKLLIAPCGAGDDFKYLSRFAGEIHGIDLSSHAVKSCPAQLIAKEGDILESGYDNNKFDLVASPLFFHHMLKIGFAPFLKEFYRVLKPGGGLVILEPSLLYPVNIITRPMKWIFNNPLNEVEDESPFYPGKMLKELKRAGFKNIELHGASFNHVLFPIAFAKPFSRFTKPLLDVYPLKYLAWMVIFWAEKPNDYNP